MSRALRSLRAPVALAVALALGGCFSDRPTEPEGTAPVSFAADVEPILAGSCAFSGCHGTTNPNPGNKPLVLAMGQAYANIVGVASAELPSMNRITVGDPDKRLPDPQASRHTHLGRRLGKPDAARASAALAEQDRPDTQMGQGRGAP